MDSNQQKTDNSQSDRIILENLQQDLNQALAGWKRTAADFENYKRRQEGENKELVTFAREVTVAKLLPALDSLEQALKHMPEYHTTPSAGADTPPILGGDGPNSPPGTGGVPASAGKVVDTFSKQYQNWQNGVNGIVMQLDKTLGELGVKKIEALGKKFDPHFHEAVREVESDVEDGMVVEEFQTGFELNGKVIRPSQVTISKSKKGLGIKEPDSSSER